MPTWWLRESGWNNVQAVRDDGSSDELGGLAKPMSAEDLEKYETEMELSLYREYHSTPTPNR